MEAGSWPPPPSSQGLRVKRGMIASRRTGPSTPVPSWNVFNNQAYDGVAAAAAAAAGGRSTPVSARKLAASLWELQDLPLPGSLGTTTTSTTTRWPSSSAKDTSETASPISQADISYRSPASTKYSNELLSKLDGQRQHAKLVGEKKGEKAGKFNNSATTSSELLKVLSRICILEEQHNSTISIASSLQVQLDQALARVQELELAKNAAHKEIEGLMKKLANVKSSWKIEQNKFKSVVQSLKDELEHEQKARSRHEVTNRKITKELMDANMAVANMVQELEREHKARELMEDVCDELAREISDDKAEVEDLKRDSMKMREELEEERRMLQLAEVWREERVQMKLGEAKLSLEEKVAVLDVLRSELETFLRAARCRNRGELVEEAEVLHNVITAIHPRGIIASYPPAEINQAGFPENDLLYTLDFSQEQQMQFQYEQHHQEDMFDPPNCGNRWTDNSGLREGGVTEGQPYMSLIIPAADEVQRTNLRWVQAEERKDDDDGCKYEHVSRSQASEYEDNMEGVADEKSYLQVNDNDPVYQQNEDSDRVVHQASEDDDDDNNPSHLYEEVEVEATKQHQEFAWRVNGMQEGICATTPLQEKESGQEEEGHEEVILHGQKPQVDWESMPQQSSGGGGGVSRNNPHIERAMKGHVVWPKGHTEAAMKKKPYQGELEQ
ncbi:unnamed protein product [Sphagnum compactum]